MANKNDALFILDELNTSPATFCGTNPESGDMEFMNMLCLHLKVQRHTKGTPAPVILELMQIHLDARTASALPAALMSAIQRHLPQAWGECCEQVASVLPGSGSTPTDRH